jgi:serine/threonine protein kinase
MQHVRPRCQDTPPCSMSSVPDLVRRSELDAEILDHEHTRHVYFVSKLGQRKVREEECWKRRQELGSGSFGAVYLEVCTQGNKEGKLRAVKEIRKPKDTNYYRELEALAYFSHANVSTTARTHLESSSVIWVSYSMNAALLSRSAGMQQQIGYSLLWSISQAAISTSTLVCRY